MTKRQRTELQHGGDYDSFGSRTIHAGQPADAQTGAVCVPISMATTFVQPAPGEHTGYEYSRTGNPTREAYEKCVASLEHAKYGVAFASGSAATASILNMFKSGDHVVTVDDVYGGTNRYFRRIASVSNGFTFSFVDMTEEGALEAAITPKTKLVWLETPSNPTLKINDIRHVASVAHAHGLTLVVDNTFMSPYFQNPLLDGADMVLHSVSKFINGHSDVIGGIVCTSNEDMYKDLKFMQNGIGAVPSPFDCYLILRGLKTLHVRMQRHGENALRVAQFLEKHNKVEAVRYPGLASHPQHALAKERMKGFGGMVTFYLKGGMPAAREFLTRLQLIALAESLGAVESLAEHPASMTHAAVPAEQRAKLGISDGLVRMSVGIEGIEDLLADLKQALAY